jgi:Glycosyl transferase family 2/Tetratricopeptide repeat
MLGGCLDSLRGQVDEIVIVDTGSVDATPDIAESYGARLLRCEWASDFSIPRNCALEAATGDWILYIDADERLAPAPGATLGDVVSSPGHAGFKVKFRPKLGFSPYRELRLFLSDPRIRFEGCMHERVMPSVERVCESDDLLIGETEAAIQHLGYEGDQAHKHARNLPLLSRAIEDNPDRVYLRWHFGETLAAVGDTEKAETMLRSAIATARRTGTVRARVEAASAFQALVRLYLDAGQASRAADVLEEGLALRRGDPVLLLLKGRALIDLGRYSEALPILSLLPLDDPESFIDPDMAYDLRVFGEWAYALIGLAEFRQRRFSEAHDAFMAAAARSPDGDAYRAKAAVAAARAKR